MKKLKIRGYDVTVINKQIIRINIPSTDGLSVEKNHLLGQKIYEYLNIEGFLLDEDENFLIFVKNQV